MLASLHPYIKGQPPYTNDSGELPTTKIDAGKVSNGLELFYGTTEDPVTTDTYKKALYCHAQTEKEIADATRRMHEAIRMDIITDVICAVKDFVSCTAHDFQVEFDKKFDSERLLLFPSLVPAPDSRSLMLGCSYIPYAMEETSLGRVKTYLVPYYGVNDVVLHKPATLQENGAVLVGWRVECAEDLRGTVFKISVPV